MFQAANGVEGLEIIEKEEIHLAIVDVMMPRMDGITMTMELLARVNSQLRRYRRFVEKLNKNEENKSIHVIGGLELNEDTVEVAVDGEPVKMTPIEYKILLLLMENPGRVFSAEEIYERVWNERSRVPGVLWRGGSTFQRLALYMEYQVLDEKGKVLEDSRTMSTEDAAAWNSLTWEEYEFGIGFSFDEDGSPKFQKCVGADVQLIEEEFRIILSDFFYAENTEELDLSEIEVPENRAFYFGMTKDNLDRYGADDIYAHSTISDQGVYTVVIMIAIVMLAALILPEFKSLTTGNEKIFRAPAELVIFLTCRRIQSV